MMTGEDMSKYKLLLVDDEISILSSLCRVFRKEGYEILVTDSPEEALDVLRREKVHVILSDYRMPGMDGVSLLNEAMKLQPDAIRMILSGYAESSVIISAINDGGAYKFITKPWDDDLLKVEVKHALERYKLEDTNKKLIEDIKKQNEELMNVNLLLSEKVNEVQEGVISTIEMLSYILRTKNHKLPTNLELLYRLGLEVCRRLGLSGEDIKVFGMAIKLNDLGNVGIDSNILNKPGKLTQEERKEVEQHTIIGETVLSFLKGFETVSKIVRYHHEHYDGLGYPDGLKGDDIPIVARIVHLLDAYDSLTSERPYRPAMGYKEAKLILIDSRGRKFDPVVLDTFINILEEEAKDKAWVGQ